MDQVSKLLKVWERHFSSLGKPVESPTFDEAHFVHVSQMVHTWAGMNDIEYTETNFDYYEVKTGLFNLNSRKAPGNDGITKEHFDLRKRIHPS